LVSCVNKTWNIAINGRQGSETMPTFKKLIIAGGAKKGTALPVFFFADVPMLFHVFP